MDISALWSKINYYLSFSKLTWSKVLNAVSETRFRKSIITLKKLLHLPLTLARISYKTYTLKNKELGMKPVVVINTHLGEWEKYKISKW